MIELTHEEILLLHEAAINEHGGSHGILNENAFESAINQPYQTFGGVDLYPGIVAKAAALGFFLTKAHAFNDGNKRVGYMATKVLLLLNGYHLTTTPDEGESTILKIAEGAMELEEFTQWVANSLDATAPDIVHHEESLRDVQEKIFNLEERTTSTIPARELALGMTKIRVINIKDGSVEEGWVDVNAMQEKFKQLPPQHPPFDEAKRELISEIKSGVDEFYDKSVDEWEDMFRRDIHVDREIAIWLHFSRVYKRLITKRSLNRAQRYDYYKVLVSCLNAPKEHVLRITNTTSISHDEAQMIIDEFFDEEAATGE